VLSPLAHLTYKFDPKGRDMIRASLTRSYKAPGLSALLARPQINAAYTNTNVTNTALAPDRIGNPLLAPELATGLDIAFRMRFSVVRTVAVLLAGTIPFASFFADHYVTRSVRERIAAQA
jgi:iron complex outermembrane receptor protein